MGPANQRKFTAFYWSFAEFGRHALSQDWAWFIGGIFLTSLVREIDGGLSRITSLVLREFFVLSSFCTGTELDLGFRRERFFFRYMCMIGDEDALRASWAFKGSSGNRICFKCKNCVRKGAELPDGEYLKNHDCSTLAVFDPQTDADVYYSADVLREAARQATTKASFEKLEMGFGLSHTVGGPLLDADLRPVISPIAGTRYDPMHCWFSNGAFQHELQLFMQTADKRWSWEDLCKFCGADWRFPGEARLQRSRTIAALMFAARKISEVGLPRLGASEALLALDLVRHFAETLSLSDEINRDFSLQLQSLRSMCSAALCCRNVKNGVAAPGELTRRTEEYFGLRNRAYPEIAPRPKLHYCLHLGDQAENDGMLLDCFVHERKHKDVKNLGGNIKSTSTYQTSVTAHAMWQHAQRLADVKDSFVGKSRLQAPLKHSLELTPLFGAPTLTARRAYLEHVVVTAGDVARLRDGSTIVVCLPVQVVGADVSIICWRTELRGRVTTSSATHRKTRIDVVSGHELTHVCTWSPADDESLLVLAPE